MGGARPGRRGTAERPWVRAAPRRRRAATDRPRGAAANLNDFNKEWKTPLISAVYQGTSGAKKAAKFLCEHGADVTLADANGMTAMLSPCRTAG